MTNDELIKEKQEQIKQLKYEIATLREPISIASLTTKKIIKSNRFINKIEECESLALSNGIWDKIRGLCLEVFKNKYSRNIKIRELTTDEIRIAARMADEIIEIWNKYVREVAP